MPPFSSHAADEPGDRSISNHDSSTGRITVGRPRTSAAMLNGRKFRGSLPHIDAPHVLQHITYRLADAVPVRMFRDVEQELRHLKGAPKAKEHGRRIEAFLDTGYGSCILEKPIAAGLVINTWKRFDPERYRLLAFVVMPNHCHVLIQTTGTCPLSKIINSWKSFTARRIRAQVLVEDMRHDSRAGARRSREGQVAHCGFWQRDYWDRFIGNENHKIAVVDYIEENPVKAGLVLRREDWPWSSAGMK